MGRSRAPTNDYTPSTLPSDHRIVVLGIPKGSNNFSSTDPDGVERLVELGGKIRKFVLATRGDFAIVKLFPPAPTSKINAGSNTITDKSGGLSGEIISMISPKEVKEWKKAGEWPVGFGETAQPVAPPADVNEEEEEHEGVDQGSDDSDVDLPPNPNH